MKQRIRLTEGQLRNIVRRCVNEAINESNVPSIMSAKHSLISNRKYYDLEGVEITDEDAEQMIDYIQDGLCENDAIDRVLSGIRQVLDDGLDDF